MSTDCNMVIFLNTKSKKLFFYKVYDLSGTNF